MAAAAASGGGGGGGAAGDGDASDELSQLLQTRQLMRWSLSQIAVCLFYVSREYVIDICCLHSALPG